MGRIVLTALVAFGVGAWFMSGHSLKIQPNMPDPHLPEFKPAFESSTIGTMGTLSTGPWSDRNSGITMPTYPNNKP
jgi:hypothetical protein